MAEYFPHAATLTVTLTVSKATPNGKLALSDAVVTSVNGAKDDRYYAFAGRFGDLVLNFKADGRPQKPAPKAVPPLTPAQVASIPGPATKPVKGKAKAVEPAPAAPAEPAALDMAAIVAAVVAALGQK